MAPSRAEEIKKIPCWGDGISGPKQCDESFECELHHRIKEAITQAIAEQKERDAKIAEGLTDPRGLEVSCVTGSTIAAAIRSQP